MRRRSNRRPYLLQKFVKITRLKLRISLNNAGFAQISSKQAFYYQTIFVSIEKGQKLATWIIHFIIGKKVSKKAKWQP